MYETIGCERIIDTFASRELRIPDKRGLENDIERHSVKKGTGLELRKRRHNRKKRTVI